MAWTLVFIVVHRRVRIVVAGVAGEIILGFMAIVMVVGELLLGFAYVECNLVWVLGICLTLDVVGSIDITTLGDYGFRVVARTSCTRLAKTLLYQTKDITAYI